MSRASRSHKLWLGMVVALLLAWLLSLTIGAVRIPLSEVASILLGRAASQPAWSVIILDIRLPKSLAAVRGGQRPGDCRAANADSVPQSAG